MENIAVIEQSGQRVLTTAQIAEAYGTTERRISENFNANKSRYVENKHFFRLDGEILKSFKNSYGNSVSVGERASSLYLWTENGALLHAKSLNTDKAWEVYSNLVENYFTKQSSIPQLSQSELILQIAKNNVELEHKIAANERKANFALEKTEEMSTRFDNAIDVFTSPSSDNWKDDMNSKINKLCKDNGLSYSDFKGILYEELERSARCNLSTRQSRLKERMKKAGATYKERQAISKIDIISRDNQLKLIFEGIVRRYQAKYVKAVV